MAASNRARYALEMYPNTEQSGDALAVLHDAYTHLELTDLAQGAWDTLALNYPDHHYLHGKKKKRSWAERLWPFD